MQILRSIQPLINLITAIALMIYAAATIATFLMIKKQTYFQMRALLFVKSDLIGPGFFLDEYSIKYDHKMEALFEKWEENVTKNISNIEISGKYLGLTLENKGMSSIMNWEINVEVYIEPGGYFREKFQSRPEKATWKIKYKDANDVIDPKDEIKIIIGEVGVFPKIKFSWKINFTDIHNNHYKYFSGDKIKEDTNVVACQGPKEEKNNGISKKQAKKKD